MRPVLFLFTRDLWKLNTGNQGDDKWEINVMG
jgi:hypothetical protein